MATAKKRLEVDFLPQRAKIRSMILVYGISNCDSVKKTRAWLATHGLSCEFHDFKKLGVPADRLVAWQHAVGWEKLLNRQGTTWRRLDAAAQASISGAASAMALMQAQPSSIKRPVVEWGSGSGLTTVGFDPKSWAARL